MGLPVNSGHNSRDSSQERWRVFCAIEIPAETKFSVLEYINRLRAIVPEARVSWGRETNIHLTLKFLGEINKNSVADLGSAIARAVKGSEPFPILISGTGVFPHRRDPRILWIGVNDQSGRLEELSMRVESECEQEGFTRDERRFHPHLTLGRLRSQKRARELARAHEDLKFAPEEVKVTEVLVIRSELSSEGSRYTTVSAHQLKD